MTAETGGAVIRALTLCDNNRAFIVTATGRS